MKFKEGASFSTSEFWYGLTAGGYINPDDLLEDSSEAKKVKEAIAVVQEFEYEAASQGIMEEM